MKKIISAVLLFLLCFSLIQAKTVQGLCVDKGHMYYVMDKVLYCQDVTSNAVLSRYEPHKDTALLNSLTRKALKDLSITADTAVKAAKEMMKDFTILNVSVSEQKIFLGIRFKVKNEKYGNWNFAFLELNENMKFQEYYVYMSQALKSFAMPPFHALEFKDAATVLLPAFNDNPKNLRLAYYEFKLDKASHSFSRSLKVGGDLGFYKFSHVMHRNLLGPVIYNVPGSTAGVVYQHPLPMLYDKEGKLLFDPYMLEKKRSTMALSDDEHNTSAADYTYTPGFNESQKIYSNVVLATGFRGEDLYMAVSNGDGISVDLRRFNVVTGDQSLNMLGISIKDKYFVFSGNTLYILDCANGKGVISYSTL